MKSKRDVDHATRNRPSSEHHSPAAWPAAAQFRGSAMPFATNDDGPFRADRHAPGAGAITPARGSAAHGYFEAYRSMATFTRAAPFQAAGKITPVFTRFWTAAGDRNATDTARDIRGFAVKFFTDEGNWDLVGNSIPVIFTQAAMEFPDPVDAVRSASHPGMPPGPSARDNFWDCASLSPESTHTLMWVMSDRGIPRSLRMMQRFGVHTYRLFNAKGESHFVKFHWKPKLGTHSLVWDEAVKISGVDPDFHRRDLWEAIESGEYPEWELGLQIFTADQAAAFTFDVLDATKLVPEELVPVTPVGRMLLDRNPELPVAGGGRAVFGSAQVVPGIDTSSAPLPAGRVHASLDAQGLGHRGDKAREFPRTSTWPDALPERVAAESRATNGANVGKGGKGTLGEDGANGDRSGCLFQPGPAGGISFVQRGDADEPRGKPETFADYYTQASLFYESQTPVEKAHIVGGFRFELSKLTVPAIRERMLASLVNVSRELAASVAAGLGIAVPKAMPTVLAHLANPEVTSSAALSLTALPGDGGIRSRSVAILVADGMDGPSIAAVRTALLAAGARTHLIAPRLGRVKPTSGVPFDATGTLENSAPVLFDGLVLSDGIDGVSALGARVEVMDFVSNQYRHGKTILALGASKALIDRAGISTTLPNGSPDPGIVMGASATAEQSVADFIAALGRHRHPEREADALVS